MLQGMDGKVAIVTGAGRGLGRVEALEFARHGARVIVNDFGRRLDGQAEESPAEEVAEEIRGAGGEAIAHGGDVANWDDARDMIALAVSRFGQLDILVNNAGFLRDRMIFNMDESDWDDVVRVHLKGHFCMSRWAAVHWRERAKAEGGPVYGRIVNTASEAGLTGSPGQPNYAAAKAGIMQLTIATATALRKYGVTANAICPRAKTRMTEGMDWVEASQDGFDVFDPANVSPLVTYLASPDAAGISGQVFIVYGKMVSVIAGPRVDRRFDADEPWTPDSVSATLTPFFAERDSGSTFAMTLTA